MTPTVTQLNPDPEDVDYKSSEDSDFNPTTGGANDDAGSSASEAEDADLATKPTTGKKSKKRKGEAEAEDLGFENSGDEATIRRGKKKKRRMGEEAVEDEEGGEGGAVKTRSMRAVEEKEKKPLASAAGATVDVDALWKTLNSGSTKSETTSIQTHEDSAPSGRTDMSAEEVRHINSEDPSIQATRSSTNASRTSTNVDTSDMIAIKRAYIFAGETITEEKLVPATSAEARLYLQSQSSTIPSLTPNSSSKPFRRPRKRVSQFEPNPNGIVKGLPPPGPKLNTIEKSKLDWAGYVDKAGIKEELDVAEKAKEGYLGRMDFLERVEAKREDDRKNAKLK